MTFARTADADINIQRIDVERIQQILKECTGEEFSSAYIGVAALSELYAEATLRKYLGSVLEVDFFDRFATALQATPSEIAGFVAGYVN